MDLPKCAACGQSVLDDDVVSCPFCGAAMAGSSGSSTATTAASSRPAASGQRTGRKESAEVPPDDRSKAVDDPFDSISAQSAVNVIACAPRKTKSRTHRIVCPMCDTPGYIPRTAAGRQVRCCSSECMVPVFTAPGPTEQQDQRVPVRISDEAIRQEDQLRRPTKPRSPMVIYGVLGGVLLMLGIGLKIYLDNSGNDEQFNKPLNLVLPLDDSEEAAVHLSENGPGSGGVDTADLTTREGAGSRFVPLMIRAARTGINRDKPLCRRQTAAALLKLGRMEEADREFAQLLVVARQRNRKDDYYRILPRLQQYWRSIRQGDGQAGDKFLAAALEDSSTIPTRGLPAVQSSISLATVLVSEGRIEQAAQLLAQHDYDPTVAMETDDLARSVWDALTTSLNLAGRISPPPGRGRLWEDPLATAVAVELGLHEQWTPAVNWALYQTVPGVQGDVLAESARQLVYSEAAGDVLKSLQDVIPVLSRPIRWRLQAVLARGSDKQFADLVAELAALKTEESAVMPRVGAMIGLRPSDQAELRLIALALAEAAAVAVERQRPDQAVAMILSLWGQLTRDMPPTADVRAASRQLEEDESGLRQKIRKHRGLATGADVAQEFRLYRSGLDRLTAAAESRRLFLVRLLTSFVSEGGAPALVAAMEENEALANELTLDPLCRLIAAEAVFAGSSVPRLAEIAEVRVARSRRAGEQPQEYIAWIWNDVVERMSRESFPPALKNLQDVRLPLPGLRACLTRRLCEHRAASGDLTSLDTIKKLDNKVLRENSLWSTCFWLTRKHLVEEVEAWVNAERLSATERVMALSGIIAALPEADD